MHITKKTPQNIPSFSETNRQCFKGSKLIRAYVEERCKTENVSKLLTFTATEGYGGEEVEIQSNKPN